MSDEEEICFGQKQSNGSRRLEEMAYGDNISF